MKKLLLLLFGLLLATVSTYAQMTVANPNPITPTTLVSTLLDPSLTFTNATETGKKAQRSTFTSATVTNMGFGSGVVLTTGRATRVNGPNKSGAESDVAIGCVICTVTPDADLQGLIGGASIYNLYKLEFDLTIPVLVDSIEITYVFGSDEYLEFAPPNSSTFNDVFGFFISGNEYPTPVNFAKVPGTNFNTSVTTINPTTNSGFYIDNPFINTNTSTLRIEYDGFTKVMKAKIKVTPSKVYHIKLAIADVGDDSYDSGIFFKANSIQKALPVQLVKFYNEQNVLKFSTASELNNDYFEIQRSEDGKNYQSIGKVKGNGTTTQPHSYSFEVENKYLFNSVSYYRLKQVDFNGDYTYSTVISLDPIINVTDVFVRNNKIIININSIYNEIVHVKVINAIGQNVIDKVYEVNPGYNKIDDIELPNNGMYFVVIINDKVQTIKKVVN